MPKAYGEKKQCDKCKRFNAPADRVAKKFHLCQACRRDFITTCQNQVKQWCLDLASGKINPQKVIVPKGFTFRHGKGDGKQE